MSDEKEVKSPNIYQRIHAVMQKIDYVKRDAKVQGYYAVTHDAVTATIRKQLIENGIVIKTTLFDSKFYDTGEVTNNGARWRMYEARYEVSFVNIDSPEDKATVVVGSHGLDLGDKAPGKAMSYAVKYAILKMFCLETGENDEGRQDAMSAAIEQKNINKNAHDSALQKHLESVNAIKLFIKNNRLSEAKEAWDEIPTNDQTALWLAFTKGGIFTTKEHEVMKSKEFRTANG